MSPPVSLILDPWSDIAYFGNLLWSCSGVILFNHVQNVSSAVLYGVARPASTVSEGKSSSVFYPVVVFFLGYSNTNIQNIFPSEWNMHSSV